MARPDIKSFEHFASIFIQKYERYLPTAFDESPSLVEKVNKVIYRLDELGLLVNEVVDQWNEVMVWIMDEGLSESIVAKLDEMVTDGTFDTIINQTILGSKASIVVDAVEPTANLDSTMFWYEDLGSLNIQMKNYNGASWDDLHPLTLDTNVVDDLGVSVKSKIDTINQSLPGKLNIDDLQYIDVMHYAERKSLDVTTAFQQCLDIANTSGSVHVLLKSGSDITLTSELKVYENTIIECGSNVTIRRGHNGYLLVNGNRSTESNPTLSGGYLGRGNITIIGGTWDGNGVNFTSKASIFHIAHAENVLIRDSVFKDPANSHHIEFNSSKNIHVTNCKFLGWAGTVDTFNEAIQLDIAKLGVTVIGADDGTPCRDVHISGCYFGPSGTLGSNNIARGIGSHSATAGKQQRNINISNCIFEDTISWAVRAYNWRDLSVSNCKFNNCGAGVNVRASITGVDTQDPTGVQVGSEEIINIVIIGNEFNGTTSAGRLIECYGEAGTAGEIKGITVANNILDMTGATTGYDAINFNLCEEVTCNGNRIQGCTGTGIHVNGLSESVSILGNVLEDITEDAILIASGSNYINISNNLLLKIGLNGIYATGAQIVTISNNTIGGVNGVNSVGDPRNHIRLVSGVDLGVVEGNICRNYSTSHVVDRAMYVTNSCTNVRVANNVTIGFTNNSINPVNGTLDGNGNMT